METNIKDTLLNSLDIGILIVDEELNIYYWNKWLEIHTKIKKSAIEDKNLTDFFTDLEVPILRRKIKTALKLNATTFYEPVDAEYFLPVPLCRLTNTDLEYMYQSSTISPYEEGKVIIAIYDQTEVKIAENRIKEENERVKELNSALKQNQEIIDENLMFLKTDLEGKIKEVSTALIKFYGYTKEELIGKNPSLFRHPSTPTVLFKSLWNTICSKKVWRGEVRNIGKDGSEHWVDAIVSPFLDKDGEVIDYTAIYNDINDKKRIEEISIKDHLTGLFNRRHFDKIYEKELNNHRKDRDLSLAVIDIDYFKKINDNFGHKTGDEVLIEFSNLLQRNIRNTDICARYGGEEFVVLLPYTSLENAKIATEKIRRSIETHDFNSVEKVTCSIGLAHKEDNDTTTTLYEKADANLYKAKRDGRNRVISTIE